MTSGHRCPGKGCHGARVGLRQAAGTYQASATLEASGPVYVELWNADRSRLLAQALIPSTSGRTTAVVSATIPKVSPPHVFNGFGIWREAPLLPTGDQLEMPVWSLGGGALVSVYSVGLQRVR